jgi:hypothetical protein
VVVAVVVTVLELYVFMLSRRQNCTKSSRADSRANCLKTSDVSETQSPCSDHFP